MGRKLVHLLRDEGGAVAIEYALILGLLSMAVVYGATQIGGRTISPFNVIANNFRTTT